MRVLMVGILAVAFAQPLWACDLCAVYAATEARGGTGKGFFAGLAEQYTYFNTFQSGGENTPNPDGERMRSLISQAFIGYNFNNRIGVQFNLPVIYKQWSKTGEQDSEAGIGDALSVELRKSSVTEKDWNIGPGPSDQLGRLHGWAGLEDDINEGVSPEWGHRFISEGGLELDR